MSKQEIKVEYQNTNDLLELIEKSYSKGKIEGKKNYISIDENDDINYVIFKNLDGATVKITNELLIDGNLRFIIDECNDDIRLYPISTYCIKENDRYSFY